MMHSLSVIVDYSLPAGMYFAADTDGRFGVCQPPSWFSVTVGHKISSSQKAEVVFP